MFDRIVIGGSIFTVADPRSNPPAPHEETEIFLEDLEPDQSVWLSHAFTQASIPIIYVYGGEPGETFNGQMTELHQSQKEGEKIKAQLKIWRHKI